MATVKITVQFNWLSKGWSETYYNTGASASDPEVKAKVVAMLGIRGNALVGELGVTDPWPCPYYWRVSIVNPRGKATPFAAPEVIRKIHSGLTTADRKNYPYLCASNGDEKRTIKLKGAPASWINPLPSVRLGDPSAGLAAFITQFETVLKAQGFGMLVRSQAGALSVLNARINANNYLEVQVPTATYAQNARVILRGMEGPGTLGLNGVWRVKEVMAGQWFKLSAKKCDTCTFDPDTNGDVRPYSLDFVTFSKVAFRGWSSGVLGNAGTLERSRRRKCCRR